MLHHFLIAFAPEFEGRLSPESPFALSRSPLFAFVNGTAAVAVFFVLSGFVLTIRAFESGDASSLGSSALRRWPRLAAPVILSNLISAAFLSAGLYVHQDRPWLDPATFGRPASIFADAAWEGAIRTFVSGSANFNAAIWTMHYELIGSFVVFIAAFVMLRSKIPLLAAFFAGLASITFAGPDAGGWIAIMILGTVLAWQVSKQRPVWSLPKASAAIVTAIFLCGFDGYAVPRGFYVFLDGYATPGLEHLLHGTGAFLIVSAILFCPVFTDRLRNPIGAMLGKLSFPIYLVHLSILNGAVFFLHQWLLRVADRSVALVVSVLALCLLTAVAAWPMMWFDQWWLSVLRRIPFGWRMQALFNHHESLHDSELAAGESYPDG
jgi:peptidoglycan/LPS O-acetylase OafA/YrhL